MNEIKVVRLKDLKQLGKEGGATARLEDGTDLLLKPHYAIKQVKGYVDGVIEMSSSMCDTKVFMMTFAPSKRTVT